MWLKELSCHYIWLLSVKQSITDFRNKINKEELVYVDFYIYKYKHRQQYSSVCNYSSKWPHIFLLQSSLTSIMRNFNVRLISWNVGHKSYPIMMPSLEGERLWKCVRDRIKQIWRKIESQFLFHYLEIH